MSTPLSKGEQGRRTRERLLAVTAELIVERGWSGFGTRDVAARAGVTQGVVSYHWRSKDDLLREAALRATEAMLVPALQAMLAPERIADGLLAFEGPTAAMRDDSRLSLLLAETMLHATRDSELQERMREMLVRFRADLAAAIRREQDAGAIAAGVDADGAAVALSAALDGLLLHAVVDPDLDIGRALRNLIRVLSR